MSRYDDLPLKPGVRVLSVLPPSTPRASTRLASAERRGIRRHGGQKKRKETKEEKKERLVLLLTPEEKEHLKAFCDRNGTSLTKWATGVLLQVTGFTPR